MLTRKQKQWLEHLRDDNEVKITPFNPKSKEIFLSVKNDLQNVLGDKAKILHMGATNMEISGKGDIDIYIPVVIRDFTIIYNELTKELGKPGSYYLNERVRWKKDVRGFEVEIFLINKNHDSWINSVKFENYLRSNPKSLYKYRDLKEKLEGKNTKEYYTRKIEFINEVLSNVNSSRNA